MDMMRDRMLAMTDSVSSPHGEIIDKIKTLLCMRKPFKKRIMLGALFCRKLIGAAGRHLANTEILEINLCGSIRQSSNLKCPKNSFLVAIIYLNLRRLFCILSLVNPSFHL